MSRHLTIEQLYPELANLHGDSANIDYLAQCRPDARIIRTALTDTPAFVSEPVDLLYLGPLTEQGQLTVLDRLSPYRDHLAARIEDGGAALFTHNAMEVLGSRIRNEDMGYDVAGLGIFDLEATLKMFERYAGKVTGILPELGADRPVVGYKAQFSMVAAPHELPGFLTATKGIGRNRETVVEGVRRGNFIGTSLLGPLLITNPHITRWLLTTLDPHSEPALAHEELALAAYEARAREFADPRRWHPFERVMPPQASRGR